MHPGYGFLSENPAFVEACADNDLVFVGPDADVMARMGDKVQAKLELRDAGVPLVPGTEGSTSVEEARAAAAEVGYPVLLKASAGGGGKGMRLVRDPDQLEAAFGMASMEAPPSDSSNTRTSTRLPALDRYCACQSTGWRGERRM